MSDLPFKPESTIGQYAKLAPSFEEDGWLYIVKNTAVSIDTPCYLQDWDGRDLSPEEQDELEVKIRESGYRLFLLWSQVNDILENLKQQKADFSDEDLSRAISFYYERDAFITI
ncbi:MAG: hypothetical protein AAGC72_12305 [Planctomycetota bacterium]